MSTRAPSAPIPSTPARAAVLLLLLACGDPTDPPPPEVLDLQAGDSTTCALLEGGDLWCWGWRVGAIVEAQLTPVRAAENHTVATFTLGNSSACVVDESQATYCWGYWFPIDVSELYGDEPTLLQDSIPLRTLDTHFGHGCGVTDEARLLCWGSNVLGKRGQGTPVVELGSTTPNFVVGTRALPCRRDRTPAHLRDSGGRGRRVLGRRIGPRRDQPRGGGDRGSVLLPRRLVCLVAGTASALECRSTGPGERAQLRAVGRRRVWLGIQLVSSDG